MITGDGMYHTYMIRTGTIVVKSDAQYRYAWYSVRRNNEISTIIRRQRVRTTNDCQDALCGIFETDVSHHATKNFCVVDYV